MGHTHRRARTNTHTHLQPYHIYAIRRHVRMRNTHAIKPKDDHPKFSLRNTIDNRKVRSFAFLCSQNYNFYRSHSEPFWLIFRRCVMPFNQNIWLSHFYIPVRLYHETVKGEKKKNKNKRIAFRYASAIINVIRPTLCNAKNSIWCFGAVWNIVNWKYVSQKYRSKMGIRWPFAYDHFAYANRILAVNRCISMYREYLLLSETTQLNEI